MKKYMICILSVFIVYITSACNNNEQEQLHKYDNSKVNSSVIINNMVNQNGGGLLSANLCVIPKEQPNTADDSVTCGAAILINTTKKQCLFSKNLYTKLYPASITKILTALVTLKKCNMTDTVTITKEAVSITESGAKKCGFNEGDKITLDALMKCMLVYSGNDAALAIAIHVSGSQENFATEMNKTCKMIGASNSNFVNPHGLHDDNQYTTPYDLYLILNELCKYPGIFDMYGLASCELAYTGADGSAKTKSFKATNRYVNGAVSHPENITVLGGKTGTTDKAGNCLILHCKNNTTNDNLISVVLNANSGNDLYTNMSKVLSYGK